MKPRSRRYIAKKKHGNAIFIPFDKIIKMVANYKSDWPSKEEMQQHWNSLAFPPTQLYRDNYPMSEMI